MSKERIYLGGEVNRVACEPLYETEAREAGERYLADGMVNRINRAANVAIAHGCWINGIYRDSGIPRKRKTREEVVKKYVR